MALHESTEESVRKHLEDVSLHTSPEKSCKSPTQDHGLKSEELTKTKAVRKVQKELKEEFDPKLELFQLFQKRPNRSVRFPIEDLDTWNMYTPYVGFLYKNDKKQWEEKLNSNERHFISHILAYFAASDGIVDNLIERFSQEVKIMVHQSESCFGGLPRTTKNIPEYFRIYSEMYSFIIETYISDRKEKDCLLNAMETLPCVGKKANWALNWVTHESATLPERVIAFTAVESIFLSGGFAAIIWLKQRGLMPGLTISKALISQDKRFHCKFARFMFTLVQKPSFERVKSIVMDAMEIEKEFVTQALPVDLVGMNCAFMCKYIEFAADELFVALGFQKVYNSGNPFFPITFNSTEDHFLKLLEAAENYRKLVRFSV